MNGIIKTLLGILASGYTLISILLFANLEIAYALIFLAFAVYMVVLIFKKCSNFDIFIIFMISLLGMLYYFETIFISVIACLLLIKEQRGINTNEKLN